MKIIPLTKNKQTLVDDEDFDWLNQWKWHTSGSEKSKFYAVRTINGYMENRKREKAINLYMHREIVGALKGFEVDHKDGNTMNNQKDNLRITTHYHNGQNLKRYINNTTGYKGVSFVKRKRSKKFVANIRVDKKLKYLGYFNTPEEASLVYRQFARKYFGEFVNEGSEES